MKGLIRRVTVTVVLWSVCSIAMAKSTITLDGEHLSIDQAWSIALGDNGVKIASNAMERMEKSYDLVMTAAHSGTPVYGLTVGVGLNKDQPIFDAKGNLTPEVIDASKNLMLPRCAPILRALVRCYRIIWHAFQWYYV